jgi:predicted PurR-regulated permease PerM
MLKRRVTVISLLVLTGIVLIICYIIASPFINIIISATVIAVVFYPIHERIYRRIRRRNAAALISTVMVTVLIIVPTVVMMVALTREIAEIYETMNARSSETGGLTPFASVAIEGRHHWINRFVDLSQLNFKALLARQLRDAGAYLGSRVGRVAGNIVVFVTDVLITLITLFFLFREGRHITRRIAVVAPLTSRQVNMLFSGISNAITASLYGGLGVAATQGVLSGGAYWALGIPAPLLFGVVTAVLSLIPVIGGALIWVPAALYLILTGSVFKGVLLLAFEGIVIGMIDSILRPYLISHRMEAHTLLLFFAILGGVRQFGVIGLFVGPVVLAIAITLFSLLREESRHWRLILFDRTAPVEALPPAAVEDQSRDPLD